LAEVIEKEYGVKAQLIRSGGGVFEVEADNVLIFSKKKQFRFPSDQEILDLLRNR
jgi:selT/selW/selH-like putative selenoprotein